MEEVSRRAIWVVCRTLHTSYGLQTAVEKEIDGFSVGLCCLRDADDVDVIVSLCSEHRCQRCRARTGWACTGTCQVRFGTHSYTMQRASHAVGRVHRCRGRCEVDVGHSQLLGVDDRELSAHSECDVDVGSLYSYSVGLVVAYSRCRVQGKWRCRSCLQVDDL